MVAMTTAIISSKNMTETMKQVATITPFFGNIMGIVICSFIKWLYLDTDEVTVRGDRNPWIPRKTVK